jgi:type IV pilus assembly protein PilY1
LRWELSSDASEIRITKCGSKLPTALSAWRPTASNIPTANTNLSVCFSGTGRATACISACCPGSYTKNTSGGVLRKKIGSITDEIVANTGQFTAVNGIVKTIDKFRIVDFDYGSHSYNSNCGWITTRPISEGECRMWGNPCGAR